MIKIEEAILLLFVVAGGCCFLTWLLTSVATTQPYVPGTYEYAQKVCEPLGGLKVVKIGSARFKVYCEKTDFIIWNRELENAK